MSAPRCLIETNRVKEIAAELGLSPRIAADAVALWQEKSNKSIEEYPDNPKILLDLIYKKDETKNIKVKSYKGDITPEKNTIFVFGSNPEGRHGAGAARVAKNKFGAQYGVGEGLTGNAYALPTKDLRVKENNSLRSISKEDIVKNIKKLYQTALENTDKQFKVAFRNGLEEIALNGYTGQEMIEMFIEAGPIPENIVFSEEWVNTGRFDSVGTTNLTSNLETPTLKIDTMSNTLYSDFIEMNQDTKYYLFAQKGGIEGISNYTNWGNLSSLEYNDENYDSIKSEIDAIFDTAINSGKTIILHDNVIDLIRELKETSPRLSEYIDGRRQELIESNKKRLEYEKTVKQANLENVAKNMEVQFEGPLKTLNSAKAHVQLYQQYTVKEKKDRLVLITRLFSDILTRYYDAEIERLKKAIENTDNISEKGSLAYDLNNTTRASVLNKVGPLTIFNEIRADFERIVTTDKNTLIEESFQAFNSNPSYDRYNESQKRRAAERMANRKINAFTKMLNNWDGLIEESSSLIKERELISLYFNEVIQDSRMQDGRAEQSEESVKEGWQINNSTVSARESLSIKVRNLLANIVKTDINGKEDIDDLGYKRLLNPSYAYVSILTACKDVITSDDFIPALEKMSKNHPWVNQVLNAMQEDPQIEAAMYHSLRRDFTNFWIQILDTKDGATILRPKRVNKHSGYYYLIDSWRNNFYSGDILTNSSIYNKAGELLKNNADANLITLTKFQSDYRKQGSELFNDPEKFDTLMDLLKSVGIDTTPDVILHTLINTGSNKELTSVLNALHSIFSEVKKGKVETDKEGVQDLINHMEGAYTNIAEAIAVFDDFTIELSFRENGKSRYSMTTPNYLGKLMKMLTNSTNKSEEEYQQMLEDEYLQYEWFYNKKSGTILNHWIELLKNNPSLRNKLEHKVLLNSEKIEYSDMDEIQYAIAIFNEYVQGEESYDNFKLTWYPTPTMSDSGSAEFIKFVKYENRFDIISGREISYKEEIMPHLLNLVKQELQRISTVKRRKDIGADSIANYDDVGDKFLFLPRLNDAFTQADIDILGIDSSYIGKSYIDVYRSVGNITSFTEKVLNLIMNKEYNTFKEDWRSKGILDSPKLGVSKDNLDNVLEEYFWNHTLATSQIIQLTTTDLAYYKDYQDFIKRFKEVHAPGLKMYTRAMYKGERIGKDKETVIYLEDEKVSFKEEMLSTIRKILNEKVQSGEVSKFEVDYIVSQYKKINITDGQGFRTLDSFRSIMGMSGFWTDALEESYNRLKNNQWDISDFFTVINTVKPYLYTQVSQDSGLGNGVNIKLPVQHKNSEAVLLAIYSTVAGVMGTSPKLKALNEFMVENKIDAVQFKSAVKVGATGVIDISDKVVLEKARKEGKSIETVVKEILSEKTGFTNRGGIINNPSYNTNRVHQFNFEDYVIQNPTPDHFMETSTLFGTQIRKLITADLPDNIEIEFNGKKYTKSEILKYYNKLVTENIIESFVELDRKFSNPKEIEKLLKEQIKGSDRYDADLLNACTLDENGHFVIPLFDPVQSNRVQELINSIIKNRVTKQKTRGASMVQMSNFGFSDELQIEKDANGKIIGYHVYLAAPYAQMFQKQISDEGGLTLLKDWPVEARKAIGYRIPTEDKYSMIPIIIDGFLPPQMGGMIMLPTGITTETGSDYDIDHLYMMLPTIEVTEEGDIDVPQSLDNREGRDNILLDIMFGILTSDAISKDKVIPGGFDNLTRIFKIVEVLKNFDKLSNEDPNLKGKNKRDAIKYLFTLDLDEIKDIAKPLVSSMNPLNPSTHTSTFRNIMNGASSIGRYAVYNASHALLQHTTMELVSPIKFMGREVSSLHDTHNPEGIKITKIISSYLAASVDNAKEGILNGLGQNNLTISITGLMANLGYPVEEITVFLNQPILLELYKEYSIKSGIGHVRLDDVIEDISSKYSIIAGDSKFDFQDLEHMAENIAFGEYWSNHPNEDVKAKYYAGQLFILNRFKYLYKVAKEFDDRISTFRADSSGGAAGPYVTDNLNKEYNLRKCEAFDYSDNPIFTGDYLLRHELTIDKLRKLADSDEGNPINQAFYTLGIEGAKKLFYRVTPYYGDIYKMLYGYFRELGVEDSIVINDAFNDFLTFQLSKLDIFSKEIDDTLAAEYKKQGIEVTKYSNQRDLFIHTFPAYFNDVIEKYPQLEELSPFLKNFTTKTIGIGIPTLVFRNVGSMTSDLREGYSKDWASLLFVNSGDTQLDKAAKSLAVNLFKYCYFRDGLSFSPKSFIHLAPTLVRLNIPGYVETLNDILDRQNVFSSPEEVVRFVDMYARHNTKNYKIWNFYSDTNKYFFEEGKPKAIINIDESTPSDLLKKHYIKVDGNYLYINNDRQFILVTSLGADGQFQEYDINGVEVHISGDKAIRKVLNEAKNESNVFYAPRSSSIYDNQGFSSINADVTIGDLENVPTVEDTIGDMKRAQSATDELTDSPADFYAYREQLEREWDEAAKEFISLNDPTISQQSKTTDRDATGQKVCKN